MKNDENKTVSQEPEFAAVDLLLLISGGGVIVTLA